MTTTDTLLLKITSQFTPDIEAKIPKKDVRVLKSLAKSISEPIYITENQSRLILKLLNEYKSIFSLMDDNFKEILDNPVWSKPFRVIDRTKRIFINTDYDKNGEIFIEFAHNAQLRKSLQMLAKDFEGGLKTISSKLFKIELTEKNIIILVDELKSRQFEIDQKIMDFYEIMKKWEFRKECENLIFGENLSPTIKNNFLEDVGQENLDNETFVNDRRIKFQYFTKKPEKNEENIENLISQRTRPEIFINSKDHDLTEVITTLKNLKRFPVLVIFDSWNDALCYENIEKLEKSLDFNNVTDHIGIYFRLENQGQGESFNKKISERKYNAVLNKDTLFAGVQAGKLPKFFLKDCEWAPKSVIVLGNSLRHSKTAVYSKRCDLIITFSDKKSIFDSSEVWNKTTWVM